MSRYKTKLIPVNLDDNTIINIESAILGGEKDISTKKLSLEYEKFSLLVENIATKTLEPLKKTKAKKVILKMGISLGVESGGITAMIVKGTGEANIEVTLEWENE